MTIEPEKKRHLFISYSRRDSPFVSRLVDALVAAGVQVWLDTDDLVPGTPNWEAAIRHAIDEAVAVILIASPDSLASPYVQGELTLARIKNLPVYPVWATGEQWIECVPLDMVNYQYIDARGSQFEAGLIALRATWDALSQRNDQTVTLSLHTHEKVEIHLEAFESVEDILNHLYINYLQHAYLPLAYGTDWVIGNIKTKQLALTWDWLTHDMRDFEQRYQVYDSIRDVSLKDFGFTMGGDWAVLEVKRIRMAGIAVNDAALKHRLLAPYGERELWLLRDEKTLKQVPPDEVDLSGFAEQFVMGIFNTSSSQLAFVQEK